MTDAANLLFSLHAAIEHRDWPCAESYAKQAEALIAEGRDAIRELLGSKKVQAAFPGDHKDCACKLCASRAWLQDAEAALA